MHKYCENETGLRIYKNIEKVKSIYSPDYFASSYLRYGFSFVETSRGNTIYKYFIDEKNSSNCIPTSYKFLKSNECVAEQTIDKIQSKYKIVVSGDWQPISSLFNIEKLTAPAIKDIKTNKTLAGIIDYRWDRGWLMSASGFPNKSCIPLKRTKMFGQLIQKTFKEVK